MGVLTENTSFAAGDGVAIKTFLARPETVLKFRDALEAAGKPHEIHVYPGAEHAFMNDRRPEGYNADAADDAWTRVLDFFGRNLRATAAV